MNTAEVKININLISELKEFLSIYFPSAYAALLSGSTATNEQNEYSDIDLVIFSNISDNFYLETFDYKTYSIQSILFPLNKVPKILVNDYKQGKGLFIDMISIGIPIIENQNYLENLVQNCKTLKKNGPPDPDTSKVYKIVVQLTTNLFKIKGCKNHEDLVFIAMDTVNIISDLVLYSKRYWSSKMGKHKRMSLSKLDPDLPKALIDCLEEIISKKDPSRLIEIAEQNLNYFGGPIPLYTTNDGYNEVKCNRLIIGINVENSSVSAALELIENIKVILDPSLKKDNFFILKSNVNFISYKSETLLLVINENKSLINNYLIPRLNTFLWKRKKKYKDIRFPLKDELTLSFNSEELYLDYSKILFSISKTIIKNKNDLDPTFFVRLAYEMMQIVRDILFKESKDYSIFLDFLIDCWIVKSYDDTTLFGLKQLLDSKENVINEFHDTYFNQKESNDQFLKFLDTSDYNYVLNREYITSRFQEILSKRNNYIIHPGEFFNLQYNLSIEDKKYWVLTKNLLFFSLGTMQISDSQKPYIPFVFKNVYNSKE